MSILQWTSLMDSPYPAISLLYIANSQPLQRLKRIVSLVPCTISGSGTMYHVVYVVLRFMYSRVTARYSRPVVSIHSVCQVFGKQSKLMAKSSAVEITTGDAHENFAFVAENSFHMRSPCDFTKVFSANFLNSLSSVNVNKARQTFINLCLAHYFEYFLAAGFIILEV